MVNPLLFSCLSLLLLFSFPLPLLLPLFLSPFFSLSPSLSPFSSLSPSLFPFSPLSLSLQ